MPKVSLKEAKADFSRLVEKASAGEFVTITRHGKATAVLVSVDAAEAAQKSLRKNRSGFIEHLMNFPDIGDMEFERNRSPSRDVDL